MAFSQRGVLAASAVLGAAALGSEAQVQGTRTPGESEGPWHHCKAVASTPAGQAFRPLDKGGCSLAEV